MTTWRSFVSGAAAAIGGIATVVGVAVMSHSAAPETPAEHSTGAVAGIHWVTSWSPLQARSGPSTSHPVVGMYGPSAPLSVVCQATGEAVGTTTVWNLLSDGSWVSDYATSTPSNTGFSAGKPRCTFPGPVMTSDGINTPTMPETTSCPHALRCVTRV